MTLEGAKFICLDEAGNHGKVVLAKGRKFTMGYYVNCDFVLVDERAKGVHCEIECDAFGRVTIRNLSPDKPILVNGSSVEIKRILLNNSKLLILDREYLWQFSKGSINEFEDLPIETASTPSKQIGFPEQPPNSCPDFKLHREMPKRFTVHNFAYCIQSDEEGNTSAESNDANTNSATEENHIEIKNGHEIVTKDSNGNTPETVDSDMGGKGVENRSITPEPNNELAKSISELLETPKMNIINCSNDKENKSAQKKMNQLLQLCHQSDLVITSFSPRETGVKIEKSFAAIIKPKVLVTKPPLTPKSVYSTPKGDMNEIDEVDDNAKDLITFHTPSTSKKGMGNTSAAKILKNSSMHLIDLTTPAKLRPASPYFKSALKVSAKKNITPTIDKSRIKLPSDEQLGISTLPATPEVISETASNDLETPSSVVTVSSSIDISSVIEISDGSNAAITSASATGLNTPLKTQAFIGACTPKKTPHSLMKRALLTSAKKQNATPQLSAQNSTTPRREFLNRKVMRGNIGLSRTPVTPQPSAGYSSNTNLPRRQSMSTPTRKNMSAKIRFDNAISKTNIDTDSPSTSRISRRSSLNPISAARYLPTSTPISGSRTNTALRTRAVCKTSPLHKVLKSSGGVPLSSHISKACRSIALPGSTSKITSIKEKSPQQLMSDRLVTRARNLLCVTPTSATSHKMSPSVRIPQPSPVPSTTTVQNRTTQSAKEPGQEDPLPFTNKQLADDSQENLSRTFIIDSEDEENVDNKKQLQIPKDATFSPKKVLNDEKEVNSNKKLDNKETVKDQQPIEIPVDVEEVANTTKGNKEYECEDKKQKDLESHNSMEKKDDNSTVPVVDTNKPAVTEESFAEVVNDLHEQNNFNNSKETVDEVVVEEENRAEGVIKTSNQEEASVVDTGFGEESFVETSNIHSEDKIANCSLNNKSVVQNANATTSQCGQKCVVEAAITSTTSKEKYAEDKPLDDAHRVELISKGDEQKSSEYKPIVEDITLEGSLIEKEAKENAQIIITKQNVTSLESSLVEEKVKDEKIKKEDTEIVLKESRDKEQLNAFAKVSDMCEFSEKDSCLDHEKNIPEIKEYSNNIQEKEMALTEIEKVERDDTNKNDSNVLESKEFDETNNFTVQAEPSDKCRVDAGTVNANVEETTKEIETQVEENIEVSEPAEPYKAYQFNADTVNKNGEERSEASYMAAESQPETLDDKRMDNDIEDTNKLLEEIEDVLNKSDEIQQKHLNELEECSDKPLSEEFETEQLSEEIPEEVEAAKESTESIKKIDTACGEEKSDVEDSKAVTGRTENSKYKDQDLKHSNNTVCQLRDNTATDPENTKLLSQDNSESTNEALEAIEEDIVTNKKILDLYCSEKSENKETENDVNNRQNIEELENVVCESEIVTPCEERSTLITDEVQVDNSTNNDENEINSEVKIEKTMIDVVQNDQNIAVESTTSTSTTSTSDKNLQVGENIPETTNKELKTIQKKLENVGSFTPRRSTRRASQSTDTPEPSAELTFTPRRSTRRGSVSAESPITCTPSRRITRRSSLSVENETPLTPKPITKRRVSISIDNETYKTNTSKIQRAKTPRKNLEQSMVIPEEMDESVNAIVAIAGEDQPARRKQLEQILSIPEEVDEDIVETKLRDMKDLQEEKPAETAEAQSTSLANCPVKQDDEGENIPETLEAREKNNLTTEEMSVALISSTETIVTLNMNSEEPQHGNKIAASEDNTNTIEDIMDFMNVQGHNNDPVGKSDIPEPNELEATSGKQYEVDKELTKEVDPEIAEDHCVTVEKSNEYHKDKEISGSLHSTETSTEDNLKSRTCELTEKSGNVQQTEISTPERSVKNLKDNPKTPIMSGVRELLKTPKAASTPRLGGIRDLLRTPQEALEIKQEEYETLDDKAELVRTPETHISEISTPVRDKVVKTEADSTKTPLTAGMRELLKTPKPETETRRESLKDEDVNERFASAANISISSSKSNKCEATFSNTSLMKGVQNLLKTTMDEENTPKLSGTCDLLQSPKSRLENNQEEIEKLSVLTASVKTEEDQNILQEEGSNSIKTDNLQGIKELLQTPKSCGTPRFKGIRELMQTPKVSSTPNTTGVKELLESPTSQEDDDLPTSTAEINETLITKQNPKHLKGIKEMPKTPKSYSTPRLKGIKELMQTPKISSTPLLTGIKELMDTPAAQEDQELEKFLRTPAAKNIMIPAMPSSAVIEKSSDSIEVSTEYDLNATNEDEGTNLEDLFKTPMTSRFVERITGSYYDEDSNERCDSTQNESLQDTINKSAEEAFDKLIGQETQILTPVRKRYPCKSFTMQTPQCQSPFTAADVLSDLPKTDVEEWIETLDQAEQPTILDCDDIEQNQDLVESDIINESLKQTEEASCSLKYSFEQRDEENMSFNESVIPETCTKVYLTENDFKSKNNPSLSYAETKDPLMNTSEKLNENETHSLLTAEDAEISGINLLDQTFESLQDEPSIFDEPLVVEEPSMFEEALIVSDNESEAENTFTGADNIDLSQDGGNGLSEPLLVSDSEEPESSSVFDTTENVLEITQTNNDILQTSNFEMESQEKSMLEKASSNVHSMTDDPLETGTVTKHTTTLIDADEEITVSENVEQDNFEIVEVLSTTETKEVLDISSKSSANNLTIQNIDSEINATEADLKHEIDAKEIAIEQTKVLSVEGEDIFVDSSVTEICEETSVLNEEQAERDENVLPIKNNKMTSDECQDIFMDNSNIDETFADEAFTKENVVLKSAGMENNPKEATVSMATDNNETVISDAAHLNEVIEYNKENEVYVNEEVVESEISQITFNANADNNKDAEKSSDTVRQSSSISQELNRDTENIYELPELLLQAETQGTENTLVSEVGSPEQIAVESSETEDLIEKHVVADSSEILVTETEPLAEAQIETQSNKVAELCQDTTLPSNSAQPLIDSAKSKKLSHEVISNSVQDETFKEVAHEALKELIPSSDKLVVSETLTDTTVPKSTKLVDQTSLLPKHNESPHKGEMKIDDSSDLNEIIEHVEEKHSEEPLKDIENISDENETIECKATTSANKAETLNVSDGNVLHVNKTEKHKCEPAKDSEGIENISPAKKLSSISKAEVTEEVLPKELDKVEVIIEKSMSSLTTTQEALSKSKTEEMESSENPDQALISSSEVIKYDFEIEIIDADHRKEIATDVKEEKTMNPQTSSQSADDTKSVAEKITSHLEQESEGKTIQVLQEKQIKNVEKTCAVEEKDKPEHKNYQKVTEVFAEENEIKESKISKPKAVRGKRTMSESSQESMQEDEMSTSTRRNRRKVIKKPIPHKIVQEVEENIIDDAQILKDRTLDMLKENEKSKRTRTTSDSMTREEISEQKQKISMESVTESKQEILQEEDIQEAKMPSNEETAQQNAETAEILTQEHKVIAKETSTKETVEIDESQKQTASTSKQKPSLSQEKPIPSDSVERFIKHENLTKVITVAEDSILVDSKEQKIFNVSEENIVQVSTTTQQGENIEKPLVQQLQGSPTSLIKQDALEKQLLEKSSNVIQIPQQEKEAEADVVISAEKTKHQISKRTRRKPCGSESNQESANTTRRKVQKIPVQEAVVDGSKADGVIPENADNIKTDETNLESGKISIEAEHVMEQIDSRDDQIVKVESASIEVQQRTEKRIRRNATLAEVTQDSVNLDDTARTRRGRRKLHKTPVEEIVIAKTEEFKQDIEKNTNESGEMKQEAEQNVNATQETIKQNIEKNINEVKEISKNDNENKIKSDIVIPEVPKAEPKETSSDVKHDPTSKPGENNKHLQLIEDNQMQEISKDNEKDETNVRRGRKKRTLQESVLEEPTTSRKSRRKAAILKTEVSKDKMESVIEIQLEDGKANELPLVIAAVDEPKANETSHEELSNEVADKDDLTPKNSESETSHMKKSRKHKHQTAEETAEISHQEPNPTTHESIQVLSTLEKEIHEVEHSAKKGAKRGRPTKNRTITDEADSHGELNIITSSQKTENIQNNDERVEMQKDFMENSQKSTKRRAAVNRTQDNKHQEEEVLIKSRKRRAGHDESEIVVEPKKPAEDSLLSEEKITEANLEPDVSLDQHTSPQEVKVRRGRKKANYEDHDESGPSIKTRVGRKKQVEAKHELAQYIVNEGEKMQKEISETTSVNDNAQIECDIDNHETLKDSKQAQIIDVPIRSRRNIGKRKPEYKEDHDKQTPDDLTNAESIDDIKKHVKEDIVSQTQEPTKKGRERKKKNDAKKEAALPTPSLSSDTKLKDSDRKESQTDIHNDHIAKEEIQNDEKLTKEPETNINIPIVNTETETPHRRAPVARKGRKAFVHITAESQEPDDTPGRRARNVPQRRAATAYHNYNETSDTEVSTKTKKKIDSPSKKSPTVTITTAPIIISPSPASATIITTARGRTRKPTAKVQQFLEEERAKAETPKKRALLAAAAAAAAVSADIATPQLTPARRGRKPSTTEIDGTTPQASKSRGRGKRLLPTKEEGPTLNVVPETITVVEEKEIALQKDPQPLLKTVKERRGGRKTKVTTDEDPDNSDEPPAKKSPLAMGSETQVSTSSADAATTATPTRVAGRRNAAAAAKARIEEDALAAAAIDPPKRARAKKVTPKVSTPIVATTNTDAHSSEVEQEQPEKLEKDVIKDKSSSQTREHRLASASTIEGIADLENENEMEADDKPANKRGHKALASNTADSPAVPAKRVRKPKLVEGLTDSETPGDSTKTTRGRGRGRKNVHLDEHKSEATSSSQPNVTDIESTTPVDTSEPVKRGTRTRRK